MEKFMKEIFINYRFYWVGFYNLMVLVRNMVSDVYVNIIVVI